MTALLGAFLGAAVGGGAFAAVLGWRGVVVSSNSRSPKSPEYPRRGPDKLPLRLFLALAGCAAAFGLTGWPVAGVLGAIGGFAAPTIAGAAGECRSPRLSGPELLEPYARIVSNWTAFS